MFLLFNHTCLQNTTKNSPDRGSFLLCLSSDKRQETHESGSLDRLRELALVLCGNTGPLARYHAGVRVQELPQDLSVLVVYVLYIVC